MTPAEFIKSWHGDSSLCSTVVFDWLEAKGYPVNINADRARRMWKRDGVLASAETTAVRLGLLETKSPKPGDPVVFEYPGLGPAFAIYIGGGFIGAVMVDGSCLFERTPIIKAWSI